MRRAEHASELNAAAHPSAWRRRDSLWRRVARVALVIVICLGAMEVGTRVLASLSPRVRRLADPGSWAREPATFEEFRQAFPDHLIPDRTWYGARCNSLGFHDQEFLPVLPPGSVRLVALGDSFAFANVPWPGAYLTVAEAALRLLGDVGEGRRVDQLVIDNLGVAGTGIESYRRLYELVGRKLSPDVVLITLYLGNDTIDFTDDVRFGGRSRRCSWLWTALVRGFAVERELSRGGLLRAATAPGGGAAAAIPPVGHRDATPPGGWSDDRPPLSNPVLSDEAYAGVLQVELPGLVAAGRPGQLVVWAALERALDDLVDSVAQDGVPSVVVLAPSRLQTQPDDLARTAERSGTSSGDYDVTRPNRWIAEWSRRRGVPVVDLLPAFSAAVSKGEQLYLVNDTHWNLRGNGLAGLTLARSLVELGIVPRRPLDEAPAAP